MCTLPERQQRGDTVAKSERMVPLMFPLPGTHTVKTWLIFILDGPILKLLEADVFLCVF